MADLLRRVSHFRLDGRRDVFPLLSDRENCRMDADDREFYVRLSCAGADTGNARPKGGQAMEVFTINHLNFVYPEQEKNAISDLSLRVLPGEFLVLCGPSGCGKSTLLRQLKTVLAPHGRRSGEILFDGRNLDSLDQREQAEKIGFVQQSPENQIATDKVWHELAFGLESLGYDTPTIRRRVAEMASFFGIQTWFYKSVTELSGGQKQLLNLASVMVLQPKVLILDEPA